MPTPMNQLPVVIDECGKYVTRSGLIVEINEITDYGNNPEVTRFNCKGYILTPTPSGRIKRNWNIFHPSGKKVVIGDDELDIISKVPDTLTSAE